MALLGWHPGERRIQSKLEYARAMDMNRGYTWVDDHASQRPWGSILSKSGEPGFITSPDDTTLVIQAVVSDGDPITDNIATGKDLAAGLGIELSTRRRNKFAGKIVTTEITGKSIQLTLKVNQALGNCPKYINIRTLEPHSHATSRITHNQLCMEPGNQLPQSLISFVHSCDMVFLGTAYVPDASDAKKYPSHLGMNHRGGRPGFIRVKGGQTCIIPDYSGNRMMQSLGNIEATPLASLTFVDFISGDILYITGNARNHIGVDAQAIMPRVNALTAVDITGYVFVTDALTVRQKPGSKVERSPYNPPVRFLAEEKQFSETSFEDVTVSLARMKIHTPNVATFTFTSSQPVIVKPGQHAIMDLTAFVGKGQYQHMAHEGLEASLNDDCIRTWTVSSSHSSATQTFDLTMKEKVNGAITSRLFNVARALSERRPELMDNTVPLGITARLVGVGGSFTLPTKVSKLLWVAGGIGITPFLSMLRSISTAETADMEPWNVVLIVSASESQLAAELLRAAIGTPSANLRLTIHVFTSQPSLPLQLSETIHEGRLTPSFFQEIEDVRERVIFVCGPIAFEEMAVEGLKTAGADPQSIVRENFAY